MKRNTRKLPNKKRKCLCDPRMCVWLFSGNPPEMQKGFQTHPIFMRSKVSVWPWKYHIY